MAAPMSRTTFPPEKLRLPFAKRLLRRKNDSSHLPRDFSNGAVAGRTGWLGAPVAQMAT